MKYYARIEIRHAESGIIANVRIGKLFASQKTALKVAENFGHQVSPCSINVRRIIVIENDTNNESYREEI